MDKKNTNNKNKEKTTNKKNIQTKKKNNKKIIHNKNNEKIEELLSITKDLTEEDIAETKPKNKQYIILVIIFITLVILGLSLTAVLYNKLSNKNNKPKIDILENNAEATNPPVEDPVPIEEKKYELNVYYSEGIYLDKKTNNNDKLLATIPTETENAKYLHTNRTEKNQNNYYILYKDNNKIKIYDTENKASLITTLSAKYDEYELIYKNDTNDIYGIAYYSNKIENTDYTEYYTSGYFNLFNAKTLHKDRFEDFYFISENLIGGKTIIDSNKTDHEVLSNKKEDSYIKDRGIWSDYYELIENDNYLSYKYTAIEKNELIDIYTLSYEKIGNDINLNLYDLDDSANISISSDNKVKKYTKEGILVAETKEYNKVLDVIKDFYLVTLNGKLLLTNCNDMEILLGNWDDSYTYYRKSSGFFKKDEIAKGKEEGIYISIDTNIEGMGEIQYYFNLETKQVEELEIPHTSH